MGENKLGLITDMHKYINTNIDEVINRFVN